MKSPAAELPLHEEVLLLSLKDREGTPEPWTNYQTALGAAIFAELLLRERVRVVHPKKNRSLVEVVDGSATEDETLDLSLERVAAAKRRASPATWVSRLGARTELRHATARSLCRQKILKLDEKKVLGIFRRKTYPERDGKPEKRILERLHEVIFEYPREIDDRTVVLLSIAKVADLLKVPFDKRDLKRRKKHIEDVIEGELAGNAAKQAIEEAQAAMMVVMMAATTSTVVHG